MLAGAFIACPVTRAENLDCSPEVNQETSGYSWTYIGTYLFASGTGAYVTLEHEGDGSVSFDAIRFTRTTGGDDVILDNEDGAPVVVYDPNEDWVEYADGNCVGGSYRRTYETGDKVTLTPDLGGGEYDIYVRWRDYSGRDRTAHYCVHNYTGHFLEATKGENGSMTYSVSGGASGVIVETGTTRFAVETGKDVDFDIAPDAGYVIDEALVDGSSVKDDLVAEGGVSRYTFSSINADHTIFVTFVPSDANSTCVEVDQRFEAGRWNLLGTYRFAAGTGAWVTLTREQDGDEGSSTCADAVRFSGDGVEVIVDNGDPEYSEAGTWQNSSGADYYGTVSRYTNQDQAAATWHPDLPASGTYSVYAWWTTAGTRDSSAPYCIHNHMGNTITVTAGENGTVSGSPEPIQPGGTVIVPTGADQTFTMSGSTGYVIEYVLVDGAPVERYERVSGTTTYTFSDVETDHTLEVAFTVGEENVTCIPVNQREDGYSWTTLGTFRFPGGTGVYVTLTNDGDGSISHDAVRFRPAAGGDDIIVDNDDPASSYHLSWSRNDDTSTYNQYYHYTSAEGARVTITPGLPEAGEYEVAVRWRDYSSRDETAEYCIHNHMGQVITATAGANGVMATSGVTIESNTTQLITVLTGSTRTFTMHPDPGYTIQDVLVDGSSVGGVTSYTFTNVITSRTIEAYFEDHGDHCDNATPVECGGSAAGIINPAGDADYFEVEFPGSGRYTFYTTGSMDTYGTLKDAFCSQIAADDDSGTDTNFSIQEDLDAGTYFVEVRHADAGSGTGAYELHVVCEHVIRASARSGGVIDPQGDVELERGGSQTFNITPDSGNTIYDVLVDGMSVGGVSTYSFLNVTENHTIEAVFSLPPATCNDISDVPLDALTRGVGAIVMFVLDDSGSMDWEFMTEEGDGLFAGKDYVFDNPGDNLYSDYNILSGSDRGRWRSQWSGYNRIYYNPETAYVPWPTLPDADPDAPRSHPYHATPTFDLSTTYYTVDQAYIVDNTGTYDADGRFVASGGTNFTVSPPSVGYWLRSSGLDWYGPDPPRSMYANTSGVTASWVPDLPADGEYEVFVWYTDSGKRDREAPYTVHHSGGDTTVNVDQEYNEGTWVSLGSYTFTAGYGQGVTLTRYDDGEADPNGETNHDSSTCADAVAFVPTTASSIEIPRAHYYTVNDLDGDGEVDSGETVYLVALNSAASSIDYYQVDTSDNKVEFGDLTPVAESAVSDTVRPRNADGSFRTYEQERQNFANWYSFYRRRELTAIAAISRTIYDLDSVYVGFRSINGDIKQPALPVNVDGRDERATLLEALYSHVGHAYGTPLRLGLKYAGQYLDQEDGSTGDMGSGVTSPWKDPGMGGECQQAFTIVMTDGYYNGSSPSVGNVDGDNGPPYADDYSETLADVAMLYYENDLVSTLDDEVPVNPYDDARHQHMVTYTVSFGVTGTLDPDDYDVRSGVSTEYPTWPDPGSGSSQKIDDLWHAAVNGRGEYLSANDPESLVRSLLTIMQNIASRTGSASSVSINGDELYQMVGEEVRMFQASYSSGTMTGDVKSYRIDQDTGEVLIEDPVWSAAEHLDQRLATSGQGDRIIVTYDLGDGGGIPFTYSDISTSGTTGQLAFLTPDWSASAAASTENLINYIRGDDTYELVNGGPFRDRTSALGDIVNSSPLFHEGVLYVGGNDGMLHALDATTGKELFGYVPGLVYDHIKDLGDPSYTHEFYVDLTPYVKEGVEISGSEKALLVGGLGKGGRGYFALDVTGITGETAFATETPTTVANRVMWEYPDSGTTTDQLHDMGYSFSRAFVAESNDTTNAPWVVIFGNGYNSENSSAVLFVLDPEDGSLLKRVDTGVTNCNGLSTPVLVDVDFDDRVDYVYAGDLQGNLWKFDLTSSDFNDWGAAFGVDNDLDGCINFADGDAPEPLFQAKGPTGSLQPITVKPDVMSHCYRHGYIVTFGTGKYLGESDLSDLSTQAVYGIWDYGDDEDDSEYLGSFESGSTPQLSNQPDSVTLLQQTASDHQLTIDVDTDGDGVLDDTEDMTLRVLSEETADWAITTTPDGGTSCGDFSSDEPCDPSPPGSQGDPLAHAGWYFNLPRAGERVVSDPMIRLGHVLYVTFTPEDSPCGSGGLSVVMEADACSGGRLEGPQFDINQDRVIDEADLVDLGAGPLVAPSGRRFTGRLQSPAILRLPGTYGNKLEKRYYSSSEGTVVTVTAKSARVGIIYWKDLLRDWD